MSDPAIAAKRERALARLAAARVTFLLCRPADISTWQPHVL